ncbi:GMC family oxidoreductase N-terminal domain-containing protein [uncultured Tateyamaria sp.]|uniref:GMC family oxidoreductase n=1 Tax=uncultured Tateyamaria sp. TaxID=455651 RepID=UPI002625523C|nr:GMC family oxidoreductase N-terminal domain-containing protein [uncultured Tateyamaria sp.]
MRLAGYVLASRSSGGQMQTEFDHIVVGGGSAGCATVARLAEQPGAQVCVIEAGPSDRDIRVKVPFGLVNLMRSNTRNWKRQTVPMETAGGRSVSVPRGKMLGGSGSINSMVWFRGTRGDFDAWDLPGWDSDTVWSAFNDVEARMSPARLPHPHPLSEVFGAVFAANDPNAPPTPERQSAGVFHCNMRNGARWSAADGFLRPSHAMTLTGAEVDRVSFDGTRATGVTLRDGRQIIARAGVVLSAGSIESPMILMRSGIGPADDLRAAGIDVRLDAPGVGANLHDHPGFGLHFAGTGSGYGLTLAQLPLWALSPFQWLLTRSGRLSSNTVEAGAFYSVTDSETPEIQTHFLPFMMGWKGRAIVWGAGYFADVCLCQPRSRGRLRIGKDRFTPLIDLNLFGDARDLDMMVAGVARLRALLAQADFGTRRAPEAFPGPDVTGDDLRETIRMRAGTAYHPVGTVALGGPLDAQGALKGVQNLWVADASVMPRITSANTNAPSMMIGWQIGGFVAAAAAERLAA